MHDEIIKVFPELVSLIKWHLCSTDEPLHYVANTVYLAGDRDHNGLKKGERRQIRNGRTGKLCWKLMAVDKEGNELEVHEIDKIIDGETQPESKFILEYRPLCHIGEGKERQLEAARRAAIWPEATDDQISLSKEELTKLLTDRLPALMTEFKATVESCGLIYQL